MALEAQRAHVGEVALAAAFGHGHDVIRVPQVFPPPPVLLELAAGRIVELALVPAQRLRIESALGAHPVVALPDLLAQVAGIRAQLPFMDALRAAECVSTLGNLAAAAAARHAPPFDPAARLG